MSKKQVTNNTADENILTLAGETSVADKSVFFCDLLMIGVFAWNQVRHGMDMLFLIIPLVLIGIWIVMFALIPEDYCFTETTLEITHKFRKALQIPYEKVFNYAKTSHDTFVNILRRNTVKVYYYTAMGKKRVVICCPKDVETFAEALRARCPEFHEKETSSSLQVFFNHHNKKGD